MDSLQGLAHYSRSCLADVAGENTEGGRFGVNCDVHKQDYYLIN